ncbi:MAG: phenylalanine--tRNA ligase subunit beta, partial [Bdellovibrionales bacterium]|nr:phenylalanine--tRNA ligase subunit beta [Bdellovibrionales bacterium]
MIYDIEVTTNRVDCMSIRGIARECAAILPEFDIPATLKPLNPHPEIQSDQPLQFEIINDPQLCHRILAIKLSSLKLGPSPHWLQTRLQQIGQRPLNNAIDITNYVMFDLGHPIHAFDFDKVTASGKLIVREARAGETFTTLDEKNYTCIGGEVIFEDGNGTIIDLPGIMGTANTVVSDDTQNVLLWIESVDAKKIRHASMTHGIRTQAAVLNEKDVDPYLADDTFNRGIQLYQELCQAQIASQLHDEFPIKPENKPTQLSHTLLESYLGISIEPDRVQAILQKLECQVSFDNQTYTITPPSFRAQDLQIPQDYIEEVARIYGYYKLPSQLMSTPIPDRTAWTDHQVVDSHFEHHLKSLLAGFGMTEIYTYSLISQTQAQASEYPMESHLTLKNPLSDDHVYLRQSLVPSHLTFLADNSGHSHLSLFELAKTYHPTQADPPHERLDL